jgi:hypothetical protein
MIHFKSTFKRALSVALFMFIIILLGTSSIASAKKSNNRKNPAPTATPTPRPKRPTPTPLPSPTPLPTPTPTPTPPARPPLEGYKNVVYVEDLGAYGDGVHDDTKAINNALNSGADAVVFEANATYKTDNIIAMQTSGVTIFGNNASLFTDDDYRKSTNYYEWYFNVEASNIVIKDLRIEARESRPVGYKTQFVVIDASNITVDNCTFYIPSTVIPNGYYRDLEYSNLDLFTGWHNVTIKNSTFINLADVDRGVNAEFRDIWNHEASDLLFTNNTLTSNCHDEILASFTGSTTTIRNLNITNNTINALAGIYSKPRTLGVSLGYDGFGLDNVIFSNNTLNVSADYAAIAIGDSTNVTVNNNTINFTPLVNWNPVYVFKGAYLDNNVNVINNTIEVLNNPSANFAGISDGYIKVSYNNITSNTNVSEALFYNNGVVSNNTIIVNGNTKRLGSSIISFKDNMVTFNGTISTMFEFYNKTFYSDITIVDNIINCNTDSNNNETLFMLNGTTMNGYVFTLSNNTVSCPMSTTDKSFYYMSISDKTRQTIVLTNNTIPMFIHTYIEGGMSSIYNIVS